MIKLSITISALFLAISSISYAQLNQDSVEIDQLYLDFEETVKNKKGTDHLGLYVYKQAPVYIVRKTPNGPTALAYSSAQGFVNGFTNNSDPLELRISDKHFHIDGSFAVTDARFDEYENGQPVPSAFGRDMFGYIKTAKGWKLFYLHNTVVLTGDLTDYSSPFPFNNTVDEVLTSFKQQFNTKSSSINELFVNNGVQILAFDGELSDQYNYSDHQVVDFLIDFLGSTDTNTIEFDHVEIHKIDDYLATAFCDYSIKKQGQEIEKGRSWFNFFGTLQDGWKISSWVRNTAPQTTTSVEPLTETKRLNLFPNPVKNQLTVSTAFQEAVEWQIIDVTGHVCKKGKIRGVRGSQNTILNTSSLAEGVYIFKVLSHDEGELSQVFVKE